MMETVSTTASKLQAGDRVKSIKDILTVVSSESHPTHKRYQVLVLQYPNDEQWNGYVATREVGKVARYDKVID